MDRGCSGFQSCSTVWSGHLHRTLAELPWHDKSARSSLPQAWLTAPQVHTGMVDSTKPQPMLILCSSLPCHHSGVRAWLQCHVLNSEQVY